MYSPLLEILLQYAGPVAAGVGVALIFKAYFASQAHNKVREWQAAVLKSHARILELEAKNDKLEKRLKEVEGAFVKDFIFMN